MQRRAGGNHDAVSSPDQTRASTPRRTAYSASNAVAVLADALGEIKRDDHLTYADIGAVLGKSEDQAAKYADGSATMDVVTFGRGRREWGARFTGLFDMLCEHGRPARGAPHKALTTIMEAVCALSRALEDGDFDSADVAGMLTELIEARDAINTLLTLMPGAPALPEKEDV